MDATRPRPRRSLAPLALLALLLALLLAWPALASGAAAASPSPEPEDASGVALAFTSWRLASLQTAGGDPAEPEAGETLSLAFGAGDTATVTTGCATATGSLVTAPDRTVVPNLAVTGENTCERRSLPERFVNLLNLATSWAFDDDGTLVLGLMDGGSIRLVQTLAGTTWRWTGFQGGDGTTVHPEGDAPATLVFGEDGVLHVSASCAQGELPYTLEGSGGLTIEVGGLETSGCAAGSGAARLMQDLGFMRSYVFREGRLFVSLMADGGIHAFVASAPAG